MAVILRSSKSTALTHIEMDGNFTDLNNRTLTVEDNYVKTINSLTATNNALTITTTNITEGTNLYYTDTRARASVSVTDSGGDGSLSYSSSTGVVTYTGPGAAEVRAHFSAGAGITVSSGAISIAADAIKDTMIDWGTSATQVSTADIPENTNLYYTNVRADARIAAASIADLSNVTLASLVNGYGLVYNSATSQIELQELPGAAGGEVNSGANVGGHNEIYSSKSGAILQFRTLNHDSNITITQSANYLTIGTAGAPTFGNLQLKTDTIENINTNSHIILSPNGSGAVKIVSNLLPNADNTYNLGASGTEWATVYTSNIVSSNVTNTDLVFVTSGTGKVKTDSAVDLGGALTLLESGVHTGSGEIRFADYDSSHYVGFKSAATVSASIMWTLPSTDGAANQQLKTDGSANLGWVSAATLGFVGSSIATVPGSAGNYDFAESDAQDGDETPFAVTTDAFNIVNATVYDYNDPIGSTVTTDYGSGESYVGA